MQLNPGSRTGARRRPPRLKPGVKREQILDVATRHFGRYGYEEAKWAESQRRWTSARPRSTTTSSRSSTVSTRSCRRALADLQAVRPIVGERDDWTEALVALLVDSSTSTEQEVHRQRVVVAQLGLDRDHRVVSREEAARAARARVRDLEFAWGTFLARGMQQGVCRRATRSCCRARARPLQQRLALVPTGRDVRAARSGLLRRPPAGRARLLS